MKKQRASKISLHRETLRNLQDGTLTGAVGGVTAMASCTVTICDRTCDRTACQTCNC
jgi:hypothetical protein